MKDHFIDQWIDSRSLTCLLWPRPRTFFDKREGESRHWLEWSSQSL